MIAAGWRQLAENDPELPGLIDLLGDRLADRLHDHDGFDHGRFDHRRFDHRVPTPRYLRYKPGTSLTVGFDGPAGPLFGYAVAQDALPKLDKLVGKAPPGAVLIHDRQRRFVLARAAADRDLPGLRSGTADAAIALAYKPQRRWVGRAVSRPDRVLRCYRPSTTAAILSRWPRPGLVDRVRTPAVADHDHHRGMISTERLPGVPLHRLTGPAVLTGWQAAGEALARWHRDAPVAEAAQPADRPDLQVASRQLDQLLPQQRRRIARLAAELIRLGVDDDHGWCHGDFSADQVLVDGGEGQIALLDWDRSGHGRLIADLANADAAGYGAGSVGLDDRAWQALLEGYQRVHTPPAGLDRARAIARFVRAVDPFRRARPDWPADITANLDRVEELL